MLRYSDPTTILSSVRAFVVTQCFCGGNTGTKYVTLQNITLQFSVLSLELF